MMRRAFVILTLLAFASPGWSALRIRHVNPNNLCGANNGLTKETGYCDLKEAEAKEQTDLVAAGDSLHIWLRAGTTVKTATSSVSISGYTVSETSSITVRGFPGEVHRGSYTTDGCYNWQGNNSGLTISDGWVTVADTIITGSATTSNFPGAVNISNVDAGSKVFLDGLIIRLISQGDDNAGYGILDQTANAHFTYVSNSIIYFPTATVGNLNQDGGVGFPRGATLSSAGSEMYLYNVTFASGSYLGTEVANGSLIVKASIIQNNLSTAFSGCASSSTDNISDDASTCGGGNSKTNQTVLFSNPQAQDWRLATNDTVAVGAASSLSTDTARAFAYDIGGGTRSSSSGPGLWDAGADEIGTDWVSVTGEGGGGGGEPGPPAGNSGESTYQDYIIQSRRHEESFGRSVNR